MIEFLLLMILLCLMFGGNNVRKYSLKFGKIRGWVALALLALGITLWAGSWIFHEIEKLIKDNALILEIIAITIGVYIFIFHFLRYVVKTIYSYLYSNHRPLANIIHNLITLLKVGFKSFYVLSAAFLILGFIAVMLVIYRDVPLSTEVFGYYLIAATISMAILLMLWKKIKECLRASDFRKLNESAAEVIPPDKPAL